MARSRIIAILLLIVASFTLQETHSNQSASVTALSLHKLAVQDVSSGKSLDSPLSSDVQGRFPKDWSAAWPANNSRPGRILTYREAIGVTEDVLANSGMK